jgi:hypothetical protein
MSRVWQGDGQGEGIERGAVTLNRFVREPIRSNPRRDPSFATLGAQSDSEYASRDCHPDLDLDLDLGAARPRSPFAAPLARWTDSLGSDTSPDPGSGVSSSRALKRARLGARLD